MEVLLDYFAQLVIGVLTVGVREVSGQVVFDDPAVTSESFACLVDVLNDLVDRSVWPVSDTIVERPIGHSVLEQWTQVKVEAVVSCPVVVVAGKHFTWLWPWSDEGVSIDQKFSVIYKTHKFPFAPFLVDHVV